MTRRSPLTRLWLGTVLLGLISVGSAQPREIALGTGQATQPTPAHRRAPAARAVDDAAAGKEGSAVAFRVCDDRTGEIGRVIKVEWVGRTEDREGRCD
jgi:hypothetical protein